MPLCYLGAKVKWLTSYIRPHQRIISYVTTLRSDCSHLSTLRLLPNARHSAGCLAWLEMQIGIRSQVLLLTRLLERRSCQYSAEHFYLFRLLLEINLRRKKTFTNVRHANDYEMNENLDETRVGLRSREMEYKQWWLICRSSATTTSLKKSGIALTTDTEMAINTDI